MASIIKRGLYWRAQVRMRGECASRTFDTKSEAEKWARHTESEIDRGTYFDRSEAESTTLLEALSRYEREIINQKNHPGQEIQRVNHWRRQPLARRTLASLRGTDFAKYRDDRLAQRRAPATVRQELQVVSHLFEICRKEFGMEYLQNPLKNIRKPSAAGNERDRRLLPGEYDRIKAELANCGNCFALPAFELAIETSLRQGMLFELRWDWVDLAARVIRIPATYRQRANKGVPVAVPLSSLAVQVLQSMPRAISGKVLDCNANAVSTIWKRRMKALGIENLHWHDLRHEAVSRFFEKGLHPMQVAAISGHKGFVMLKRYTHLSAESLAAMLG